MRFGTDALITKVRDHTTAATTNLVTAIVDMAGYEGIAFITSVGTAGASNSIKVMQDDANATAGMADLEGTLVGVSTSDEDLWVDVFRPAKRYVQAKIVRTTSTTCESVWAVQYGAKSKPTDNTTAGTIHGELHETPDEGTA